MRARAYPRWIAAQHKHEWRPQAEGAEPDDLRRQTVLQIGLGGVGKTCAGYALDAHVQEPLPPDSPLWDLPNVIVTPHNAAASTGNDKRRAEIFIANFGRWLRGEKMANIQDVS